MKKRKAKWKSMAGLDSVHVAVGNVIRARRERIGMMQKDLAEEVGVNSVVQCLRESGERAIGVPDIFAYAIALGVSPNTLFSEINAELKGGD